MGCNTSRDPAPVPEAASEGDLEPKGVNRVEKTEANAMRHYFRGNGLMEQGEYDLALHEYTVSILDKPDFVSAYYERGLANEHLGKLEEALADFGHAIRLKHNHAFAHSARAAVYAKLERYEDAIADCCISIEYNNEDALAFSVRGKAYSQLGEADKAFEDFERAGNLESRRTCVVCMENPRGARLHPCLHAALCATCAKNFLHEQRACPLCGKHIDNIEFGSFDKTFAFDDEFATSATYHPSVAEPPLILSDLED
ncbi:hypothetical protein CYMTET_51548 [Cymbomonas tetramitiformis]|uniref:RING-type domain-containing protein n=1 Tax=Cymbomonas tetramitiformis TaxID=36881 RepID=A0AAE0BM32_9CHLO|nr:hypothetical protein CYMTET_51548 [Cymbomonas tetramitiformis]